VVTVTFTVLQKFYILGLYISKEVRCEILRYPVTVIGKILPQAATVCPLNQRFNGRMGRLAEKAPISQETLVYTLSCESVLFQGSRKSL